ncbi:hypothetical protein [Asticcacaulis biprosthecium]|uniref:hypothetical protein n=1 Tax=Asticcacaulis biprosthecium TaxID=76891 RepID=UPI000590377B|nr:hypothetical protein [Asticcacaulis biprosthecium]
MTDNRENASADSTKTSSHLLAGAIELTPEARAILTKQVNRRIVWGYKVTKAVFQALACTPLLISAFFLYVGITAGRLTIGSVFAAFLFIALPAVLSMFFLRLANKL